MLVVIVIASLLPAGRGCAALVAGGEGSYDIRRRRSEERRSGSRP
jgi:hypothetical protein